MNSVESEAHFFEPCGFSAFAIKKENFHKIISPGGKIVSVAGFMP
jgi:hypothetical protein